MNRFLWVARGDIRKLKLAALCQFTLVGAPVIYYGTEVGLSQHNDVMQNGRAIHEEARLPMPWGQEQNTDLFKFYRALCNIRNAESALRHGTRQTILADGSVLAYRRVDHEGSLLCVMNITDMPSKLELDITESKPLLATSSDCEIQPHDRMKRIILPPFSGMLLK